MFNKSSRNSKKQDVTEENNEDDEDPVDEDPVDEDPVDEDPVDEDPVDEPDVVSTPATTPRPESTKGWSQTISKPKFPWSTPPLHFFLILTLHYSLKKV